MKTLNTDNRFDVVVFDFDNTLFAYEKTEQIALKSVFDEMNISYKAEYHGMFKNINRRLWDVTECDGKYDKKNLRILRFKELFEELGFYSHTDMALQASEIFVRNSERGYLIEGVKETLWELKKRGLVLAVASAGLSNPRKRKLETSEIYGFIDYALFREDFGDDKIKPHEDFFIKIAQKSGGIPCERILYVGDTFESDIKGSKLAGFSNVWFNYFGIDESKVEMKYCDAVIYQFSELTKIICDCGGILL